MRIMTELEVNRDKAKAADPVAFVAMVYSFVAAVQAKTNEHTKRNFPNLTPDTITAPLPWGGKYIRIVRSDYPDGSGSRSVHCFIDASNGDILKSAGWKAPAKHARGNIFADDFGMSCMDPYGPKYLR